MRVLIFLLLTACPCWAQTGAAVGRVAPDGTEPQIDLPHSMHRRNTSSKGLGNCVFTSIHHSAMWAEVPALKEFPKWVIDSGIPGGSYPSKTATLIKKMCSDRKLPEPQWIQVEGIDLDLLRLACKTGRMPAVTYARSPTGRYGGSSIAHMVSLVHADSKWFGVLDNNYPGADAIEWMSESEYLRTDPDWMVILLEAGPPPPPRNLAGYPGRRLRRAEQSTPSPQHTWQHSTEDAAEWKLLDASGKHVGSYWTTGSWAGQYRPWTGRAWGEQATLPIPAPMALQARNFGVDKTKVRHGEDAHYWLNGEVVTRETAVAAIEKQVPDDTALLRLTVIGPEAERKRVRADLDSSAALAPWKGKLVVKDYPADHWHVAEVGFWAEGKPSIYLQQPDGRVLFRQDGYTSAEQLATAIRKRDPNYDPKKDPDPLKPAGPALPDLKSLPPWVLPLGAFLLVLFLARKKES